MPSPRGFVKDMRIELAEDIFRLMKSGGVDKSVSLCYDEYVF